MKIFSEYSKKIALRREICEVCPHKTKNALNLVVCELCGCPIATKSLVPTTSCPDNPPRWT